MPTADRANAKSADARRVLSQAAIRAADLLELNQGTLARILGVSAASVSRMREHEFALEPDSKPWEHAVLFVRLFRALQALVGERDELARSWLRNPNRDLGEVPADMIRHTEGLVRAVHYVDAARGRI